MASIHDASSNVISGNLGIRDNAEQLQLESTLDNHPPIPFLKPCLNCCVVQRAALLAAKGTCKDSLHILQARQAQEQQL